MTPEEIREMEQSYGDYLHSITYGYRKCREDIYKAGYEKAMEKVSALREENEKLREVLSTIIQRYEVVGPNESHKSGVTLGIYQLCKDAMKDSK
ncbi:MAG: hypothetical protein NVS3B3_06030 [Aquirhabdus sp.]